MATGCAVGNAPRNGGGGVSVPVLAAACATRPSGMVMMADGLPVAVRGTCCNTSCSRLRAAPDVTACGPAPSNACAIRSLPGLAAAFGEKIQRLAQLLDFVLGEGKRGFGIGLPGRGLGFAQGAKGRVVMVKSARLAVLDHAVEQLMLDPLALVKAEVDDAVDIRIAVMDMRRFGSFERSCSCSSQYRRYIWFRPRR